MRLTANMKRCPKCDELNHKANITCWNCYSDVSGAKIVEPTETTPIPQAPVNVQQIIKEKQEESRQQIKQQASGIRTVMFVAAFVCLLIPVIGWIISIILFITLFGKCDEKMNDRIIEQRLNYELNTNQSFTLICPVCNTASTINAKQYYSDEYSNLMCPNCHEATPRENMVKL